MIYKLNRKHLHSYLTFYFEYLPYVHVHKSGQHHLEGKGEKGGKAKIVKKKQ